MRPRCLATRPSAIAVVLSMVALVTMLAALTVVPGPATSWVTTAGLLLLALSGLCDARLRRRGTRTSGDH